MDNNLVGGLYNIDMLEELEKGKAEDVAIKLIEENTLNEIYDKRDLTDLKETIVKDGLLQPLVAYKKNDKYIFKAWRDYKAGKNYPLSVESYY